MPVRSLRELTRSGKPLICAHRVNTRRRLSAVLRLAPHMIEFDVNEMSGELVAMHGVSDPPLRNPLLKALIREIERTIVGDPRKPLALRNLLQGLEGVGLWIDVKKRGIALRAVEEVYRVCDPTLVALSTGFYPELRIVKREHPEVATFLGNVSFYPPSTNVVHEVEADGVSIEHTYLDEELVHELHRDGVLIAAWTVNRVTDIARVARIGVDVVITDFPDLAFRAVEGVMKPELRGSSKVKTL